MLVDLKKEFEQIKQNKEIELRQLDLEIRNNRNKKRFFMVTKKTRLIVSKIGNIKIHRSIYWDNIDKKYVALLDEKLGLPKRSRIDPELVNEIKMQIGSGKRYRDILDMFKNVSISKMTISRIYKSVKNEELRNKVSRKIKLKDNQHVYIYTDDTWPIVLNNKFRRSKLKVRTVSFSTGHDPKTMFLKRKKLLNKRTTFFIGKGEYISTEDNAKRIKEIGNTFYENFDKAHLILGGDGAGWIKELANYLDADYVLDKYHAFKKFKDIFITKGKKNLPNYIKLYKLCTEYFNAGMFDDLMAVLKIYADKQTVKYFKNNYEGIINQAKKWNIGVSAESDISRVVKSCLGYGSRLYSFVTLTNILNQRVYNINNLSY